METELTCFLCDKTIMKVIPDEIGGNPIFCDWDCFDIKVKELFKADIVRKLGRD